MVAVTFPLFHLFALQLLQARNMLLGGVRPCRFSAALTDLLIPI